MVSTLWSSAGSQVQRAIVPPLLPLLPEDNIHKDCLKELTGYHTLAIFRDMAEDNFTRVSYEYCFKRLKQ
jgi:hypothetical protein